MVKKTIFFLIIGIWFLIITGLIFTTLKQLQALALETHQLGLLKKELKATEIEYETKRIEASKIDKSFLNDQIAKLNFEQVKNFNFIKAQETLVQK